MREGRTVSSRSGALAIAAVILLGLCHPPLAIAEVTLDGSLGPAGNLQGPAFQIPDTVGTRAGANLFHSFGQFNIAAGESATFTNTGAPLANVIARVTGGTSSIDGLVQSAIPDANLFLLNPAGVMFGPNASLDVAGSFHLSTADYLKFSTGEIFHADPASSSILSVAIPESFGFLVSNPAAIISDQAVLQVHDGQTLSLIGGSLQLINDPSKGTYFDFDPESPTFGTGPSYFLLSAPGGRINLASVAAPGEINLGATDLGTGKFSRLGSIKLENGANLNVATDIFASGPGGEIVIRGGEIVFRDLGILGLASGIEASGSPQGVIAITGENLKLDTSFVASFNTGEAGLSIDAPDAITLDLTDNFTMSTGSMIESSTFGFGPAGNITIAAANGLLTENSLIASSTYAQGRAGDIAITAADLAITGGSGLVSSTLFDAGRAGDLRLETSRFSLRDGSFIDSSSNTEGRGGDISITGSTELIIADRSAVTTNALDRGGAGNIALVGDKIALSNAAQVKSVATNSGDAGSILLNAGTFTITQAASMESLSVDTGHAGNIDVNATSITLGDDLPGIGPLVDSGFYGTIRTSTDGSGQGGDINLTSSGELRVQNGFSVYATGGGMGASGNIHVQADTLKCLNKGDIGSNISGSGVGGLVEIRARDILFSGTDRGAVLNQNQVSGVSAQVSGSAQGGRIQISADKLTLIDGGQVSTLLTGSGSGADISVKANQITISGYALVTDPEPVPFYASIDARVSTKAASGTGGNITIDTQRLSLNELGNIRTSLHEGAPGNAGNISVTANTITIGSLGRIYADSFLGTGNSGNLNIAAQQLTITGTNGAPQPTYLDNRFTGLSTTTNAGHGGAIHLNLTGDLTLSEQGGIRADTQGSGTGGAIVVQAGNINLASAGEINSSSSGTGNAGDIDLAAADSITLRNGAITTEALLADGGSIHIVLPKKLHLIDSKITASVGGGPETNGGNIIIDPEFVILKNSRIVANAFEGKGGNIGLVAQVLLADPQSLIDASSALGIDGTVDIHAPVNNVSGLLTPLPADFTSASALLRERCMARIREGKYSSLVVGGREGLPLEPGNLLPSKPF